MTLDELRAKHRVAYRIIMRERAMRERVFRSDPVARQQKLAEMDRLLEILTELKDELKAKLGAGYEQPPLLDVPKKTEYR